MPRESTARQATFRELLGERLRVSEVVPHLYPGQYSLIPRLIFEAAALGLFVGDDNAMKKDYANLIQRFNRWLTTTFAAEDNLRPTGIVLNREAEAQDDISNGQILPHISQVMALQGQTESMCLNCRSATSKQFLAHVVDLVYPRRVRRHIRRRSRPYIDQNSPNPIGHAIQSQLRICAQSISQQRNHLEGQLSRM